MAKFPPPPPTPRSPPEAQILTLRRQFDEILTLRDDFSTRFWKMAQILTLRGHFDEILTLRSIFPSRFSKIAQIPTLRAPVHHLRRSDFIRKSKRFRLGHLTRHLTNSWKLPAVARLRFRLGHLTRHLTNASVLGT